MHEASDLSNFHLVVIDFNFKVSHLLYTAVVIIWAPPAANSFVFNFLGGGATIIAPEVIFHGLSYRSPMPKFPCSFHPVE